MTPFFYSVRAFARIQQTLLLKILGGRMHGPSPTSNLGGRPPVPLYVSAHAVANKWSHLLAVHCMLTV